MMGRSFLSVRMGVQDIAVRWERAARAMKGDDAVYADKVVAMAKTYASEAFYAFDDPLESAFFSVILCMCREHRSGSRHFIPGDVTPFPGAKPCIPTKKPPLKTEDGAV